MFSGITITIISSVFYLFLCFLIVLLFYFLLRPEPSFVFLSGEEKRKLCLNHVKPLRFPKPELQSSCPSCFVFAHFFSQCEHSFIDNPMIITEPAVTCARLLSLGSKPYPSSEFQGVKTFCPSFCASLIAGSRRAFLCVDCVCLLLEF